MERTDPSYKGQAGYNPLLLGIYDAWVLKFMAPTVWKMPVPPMVELYRRHLGSRHLDVGPGTGYFIEKARPAEGTEVTLLDPNPHVLEHASRRLESMAPSDGQGRRDEAPARRRSVRLSGTQLRPALPARSDDEQGGRRSATSPTSSRPRACSSAGRFSVTRHRTHVLRAPSCGPRTSRAASTTSTIRSTGSMRSSPRRSETWRWRSWARPRCFRLRLPRPRPSPTQAG